MEYPRIGIDGEEPDYDIGQRPASGELATRRRRIALRVGKRALQAYSLVKVGFAVSALASSVFASTPHAVHGPVDHDYPQTFTSGDAIAGHSSQNTNTTSGDVTVNNSTVVQSNTNSSSMGFAEVTPNSGP